MITCQSGRPIIKKRNGVETYVIRLNLVITDPADSRNTKYKAKEISTGLKVNKKNLITVNAMIADEIKKYSVIGNNMPFHLYCLHWLEQKKLEVEVVTYEGYQYRIDNIVSYFEKNPVAVGKVSAKEADAFYHYLLTKKKACPAQRSEKGLSNRTIKDIASLFRAILSDALELGHAKDEIRTKGAINRRIPKKPEDIRPKAYIGSDEADIFLDAIKGHRLELAFLIAIFYGLRREEILGLKWSALRNGRLYIEHTVSRMHTTVAKDRTKTDASYRDYPVPPQITEKLDALRAAQQQKKDLMGKSYQDSGYIFCWEDGRPYTPDYLTKSFKKLVRADDRLDDNLTLHSLRASCVSILVHMGVDIKDVQKWVGHSDIQTTLNIYAQTNQKQQDKTMNHMVDALLLAGSSGQNS